MVGVHISRSVFVAAALGLCGACQSVGPLTIDAGRDRYNTVIQTTAKVQTLANIVRVKYNEPMSFMDVTEVDTGTSVTGVASGAITGIGPAKGTNAQLGSITSGVTYTENPTIRYIPLTGQGLVAQLLQPLTPDALVNLLGGSYWEPNQSLELTTGYLSADLSVSPAVTNIIEHLWNVGPYVRFVAVKSELTPVQQSSTGGGQQGAQVGKNSSNRAESDSITIFFQLRRDDGGMDNKEALQNWMRLLYLYYDSQVNTPPKGCQAISSDELRAWDLALNRDVPAKTWMGWERCLPHSIELRAVPPQSDKARSNGVLTEMPQLKTYSASGILRSAISSPPEILFATPNEFSTISRYPWNTTQHRPSYYYLSPEDTSVNLPQAFTPKMRSELLSYVQYPKYYALYEPTGGTSDLRYFLTMNTALMALRCYVLIIMDDHPPKNAYVAYFYQGKWYYIDGEDKVSRNNFDLISQLLTVMAVPPTTQPLTPTISVN